MITRRTNQGGSTLVFAFVGVALLIALISLVYFVKVRGEQARKDQAIAAYDKQKADETKSKADDASKDKPKESTSPSNTNVSNPSDEATVNKVVLPATGPELFIGQIIGAGLITMSVSAYVASRRQIRYL